MTYRCKQAYHVMNSWDNRNLKPENIFIHIQSELPISEGKEGKKNANKKV